MPDSTYQPPFFFANGHLQSIYPTICRRVEGVDYQREIIFTPDQDFLELDWLKQGAGSLVIIAHGLEGSSSRAYVKGMARALHRAGFDVLAWNFRACGGTVNLQPKLYHSGFCEDLETVIDHVLHSRPYSRLLLCGFSMGGNVNLLYLGRKGAAIDSRIKACVAFSVPCDLAAGSRQIARRGNQLYMRRFLCLLHEKIKAKKAQFPELFDDQDYHLIKDFKGFDDRYTAPLHGFKNAEDYWRQCSSKPHLPDIRIPTLLISALDDPFLPDFCYPRSEVKRNPWLRLETPTHGGHVGFVRFNRQGCYWSESRATAFFSDFKE
ncbi:MAG: alpha/beta fold hydrolase [Deltaproteobacteria bacterium]|nr:alpha/beta fold hydrolase [Deltaproteobacteria bacterium]